MIENIKARFKAKRFNIWTEQIDRKNREGYFIYKGNVYFGNRFGVFFRSYGILFKDIFKQTYGEVTNETIHRRTSKKDAF